MKWSHWDTAFFTATNLSALYGAVGDTVWHQHHGFSTWDVVTLSITAGIALTWAVVSLFRCTYHAGRRSK